MSIRNSTAIGVIIALLQFIIFLSCNVEKLISSSEEEENAKGITVENTDYLAVFNELRTKDSLLFHEGFNNCDTSLVKLLTSDDFEFYHDQYGITDSKKLFVQSIVSLCEMHYRPTRELVNNSLQVHLLYNNGELYGAIQQGQHEFYGQEEGAPKYLTSTADFTHLWLLENRKWKLKRVLSYNHIALED